MPGMNGLDLVARLRTHKKALPGVHEAPAQEPWYAAAGDIRHRYAAGQL